MNNILLEYDWAESLEHSDYILDLIRQERNKLIKEHLYENRLELFYKQHDNILNEMQRNDILCCLTEFLISPVNIKHYSLLMQKMLESTSPIDELRQSASFFEADINNTLIQITKITL